MRGAVERCVVSQNTLRFQAVRVCPRALSLTSRLQVVVKVIAIFESDTRNKSTSMIPVAGSIAHALSWFQLLQPTTPTAPTSFMCSISSHSLVCSTRAPFCSDTSHVKLRCSR